MKELWHKLNTNADDADASFDKMSDKFKTVLAKVESFEKGFAKGVKATKK